MTTEVPDLTFTHAVTIHVLILYNVNVYIHTETHIHTVLQSYPVEHGQAHPHYKGGRGEVNPLREIGEQLVVEALHPVSVTALRNNVCSRYM